MMTRQTTRNSDHGDAGLLHRKGRNRADGRRSGSGFGEALATLLSLKS